MQTGAGDPVVLFSFSLLSREGRVLLEQSRSAGYRAPAFVSRTCLADGAQCRTQQRAPMEKPHGYLTKRLREDGGFASPPSVYFNCEKTHHDEERFHGIGLRHCPYWYVDPSINAGLRPFA